MCLGFGVISLSSSMVHLLSPLSVGGRSMGPRSISSWYKDVALLGSKNDDLRNWFETGLVKKVGSDHLTSFRKNPWIGSIPLQVEVSKTFYHIRISKGIHERDMVFN